MDLRSSLQVTSPTMGIMLPWGDSLAVASSISFRRPMMYTLCAPLSARALAIMAPRPLLPPVMTATRPFTVKRFAASREDMVVGWECGVVKRRLVVN